MTGFRAFVRAWNDLHAHDTPRLHRNIAAWLERGVARQAQGLLLTVFRGGGKSTLVGLLCAWLLWRVPTRRILVVAAEQKLARKTVRQVRGVIERHPATPDLKPARPEQWGADELVVQRPGGMRDPSLLARGITGNLTGSRADFVICDDVEVPNTAGTPDKRAGLRERLGEVPFILVPGGLALYVGTPHARDTIYATAVDGPLAGFGTFRAAIYDRHTRSRWPQRFSPAHVERLRQRQGPAQFAGQMLLEPRDVADVRLNHEAVRRYGHELRWHHVQDRAQLWLGGVQVVDVAAAWDPAHGGTARGDGSVLAIVYFAANNQAFVYRVTYLRATADDADGRAELAQMCDAIAATAADLALPGVVVETNGLGTYAVGALHEAFRRARLPTAIRPVHHRAAKAARIVQGFDGVLSAGLLHVHDTVWDGPFMDELRTWTPDGHGRDDGLDAVAMCLATARWRIGTPTQRDARPAWRPGAAPATAPHDFTP